MADINTIAEELGKLTIIEAAELVKLIEEKWGVSAAAPVAQCHPFDLAHLHCGICILTQVSDLG